MKTSRKLPVLDQASFPAVSDLPALNENGVMHPAYGSDLQRYESEVVLAIVATHAKSHDEWCPMSEEDFNNLLKRCDLPGFMYGQVSDAILELCRNEFLDLVQVGKETYLVPSPKFAGMLRFN